MGKGPEKRDLKKLELQLWPTYGYLNRDIETKGGPPKNMP
jgi:hypothetical protein